MAIGVSRVLNGVLVALAGITAGCASSPPSVRLLAAPQPTAVPATVVTSIATTSTSTVPTTRPATTTTSPPEAPTTTVPRVVTMAFTGDVLPHPAVVAAARRPDGIDFAPMFAAVAPLLSSVDLAICHLETPVAPPGRPLSGFPRFAVPAEIAAGMATAGIDQCSTASNHALDEGAAGVDATIASLTSAGIAQAGMASGPDGAGPLLADVGGAGGAGGVRVAHLSATYGFNGLSLPPGQPWRSNLIDADRLIAEATAARAAGARIVIVSLHWGTEYQSAPTTAQRSIADRLTASGQVDLVVGHHAHVLQPIEQVNGRWVVFGLGNLLSNQSGAGRLPDATEDGAIVRVRFTEQPDGSFVAAPPEAVATWVDRKHGFVIRPVDASLADPSLGAIRAQLAASRARTTSVLGPFLVPG